MHGLHYMISIFNNEFSSYYCSKYHSVKYVILISATTAMKVGVLFIYYIATTHFNHIGGKPPSPSIKGTPNSRDASPDVSQYIGSIECGLHVLPFNTGKMSEGPHTSEYCGQLCIYFYTVVVDNGNLPNSQRYWIV